MPNIDELSQKKCRACHGEAQPLAADKISEYLRALPCWDLAADGKSISRTYVMKNFLAALDLIQAIAPIA